ncbi:MAG: hypothetical protein ACRYHA_17330 [Janthinobacterium lividum]
MRDHGSLQKGFISLYRLTMGAVLLAVIGAVLSYFALLAFYAVDRNWSTPLVLSPTQVEVLDFQSRVASLEAALSKNEVDLSTAMLTYQLVSRHIDETQSLIDRFHAAAQTESKALSRTGGAMRVALHQKVMDSVEMAHNVAAVKSLRASTSAELAAGLITKDQAMSRRLTLQSSLNTLGNDRVSQVVLDEQARNALNAAATLGSDSATSLSALQSFHTEFQLITDKSRALIETESARRTIVRLRASIADMQRALAITKQSPYYRARALPLAVVFTQYDNLSAARPGAPVYDCLLQIIACRRVGTVSKVFDAEAYSRHPLFKTDTKGKYVGVDFADKRASESRVVFLTYKPLLF